MTKEMIDEICEICKINDIPNRFEIEPNHNSSMLTYLNFMGAIGGIYIRTGNATVNKKIILDCLIDSNQENFISSHKYIQKIINSMGNKYEQTSFKPNSIKSIIILPGSNILDITVDYKKLGEAVSEGAFIKPHPYTEENDVERLKELYGDKRVLNKMFGGCDIIKKANVVYATGASELSLYSIALGKVVKNIGNKTASNRGGYCAIFDVLDEIPHYLKPMALNKILSHKYSGIFFPFDYEEKNIENFILKHF